MTGSGRVVILGVGGGGGKIASTLAVNKNSTWLDIGVINTDEKELNECHHNVHKIQIGSSWTDNQGCGGDYLRGQKAAGASSDKIIVPRVQRVEFSIS